MFFIAHFSNQHTASTWLAGTSMRVDISVPTISPEEQIQFYVHELQLFTLAHDHGMGSLLRDEAIAYLQMFIDRSKVAPAGEQDWQLDGLICGCYGDAANQIRLCFTIASDLCGEWAVVFEASGERFLPIAFSRRRM
jgi:hypothetical protein